MLLIMIRTVFLWSTPDHGVVGTWQ